MYGWGCKLPIDELWRYTEIDTPGAHRVRRAKRSRRIFQFGRSDLHIHNVNETLEFTLYHESEYHESDIHFASRDPGPIERAIALWREQGLAFYRIDESRT